ncbi:hypothetical protein BuS5_00099 [Desulfosarcina sp. BuS5]|uniref:hypothetical protein n=1 Tax=Desulfosarcina sp. BuS5 TaxID=933262 RepID=UPI000486F484|nr:hypothetical protein [Desulfosarcina sp. BuS5]WDN87131.1 hypothetical protein BuS5_00099 [Desulfosarcina sp. BuS5]
MPGESNNTIKEIIEPWFNFECNVFIFEFIFQHILKDGGGQVALVTTGFNTKRTELAGSFKLGNNDGLMGVIINHDYLLIAVVNV